MAGVRAAIVSAISVGAPLYNKGQPALCYQLYKETAQKLLDSGMSKQSESETLRAAIQLSYVVADKDPSEAAWVLRRAFDSILDRPSEAQAAVVALPPDVKEVMVLDLSAGLPEEPKFVSMDDVIMGGISSSTLVYDVQEQAVAFTGYVTTDSGGGFASIRSQPWQRWGLGPAQGLRLKVKGDGKCYKVNLKGDNAYDGIQYQQDFTTLHNQWQEIDLPFSKFNPTFRGQLVRGRQPITGQQIRQLGFMISKFNDAGGLTPGFQSGNFRLEIKWIKVFL